MMRSLAVGTILAGTLLITGVNIAFAQPILPPMVEGANTWAGLVVHQGFGEASSIYVSSFGNFATTTDEAIAGSIGPSAALVASLKNWNAGSMAAAGVSYYFAVVPNPGFPIAFVPVTVAADLQTSALLSGKHGYADLTASAEIGVYMSSNFSNLFPAFQVTEKCSIDFNPDNNVPCVDTDDSIFVNGFVPANQANHILIGVHEFSGGSNDTNVDVLASADPIIQIADALIPGTNINFRDAYMLEFSDGVTQALGTPLPAPEPPSALLLLVSLGGLLAILGMCRRGRTSPVSCNWS